MDFNAYVQGCKENSPEGDFAQDWDQDRNKHFLGEYVVIFQKEIKQ